MTPVAPGPKNGSVGVAPARSSVQPVNGSATAPSGTLPGWTSGSGPLGTCHKQ